MRKKTKSHINNISATKEVICPYCNAVAVFTDSAKIYGRSYGMVYLCANYPTCHSWVGVHKGTNQPLGRLANGELRRWKQKAHNVLDQLWHTGLMSRKQVYTLIQSKMGLSPEQAHIGEFDVSQCQKLIEVMQPELERLKGVVSGVMPPQNQLTQEVNHSY